MLSARKLVAVGAVLVFAGTGVAVAQNAPSTPAMAPDHMQEMMRQHQGMMPMGAHAGMHTASTAPTMPGQDAFGAIQEIVGILDADPKTDWSKVDLEALRQHLIDMNEITREPMPSRNRSAAVWRSRSPASGVLSSPSSG